MGCNLMAEITLEELQDETLLRQKLEANEEELAKIKRANFEVIEQQALLLEKKIEKFTPIMRFIKDSGYYITHPTLSYKSSRGAVLDFDEQNNLLYFYDLDSRWIKKINMYNTEDIKSVSFENFAERRNLDNAIAGLNYLLVIQDEIKNQFLQDRQKREKWLKENEVEDNE